jgi:hypothetical protein
MEVGMAKKAEKTGGEGTSVSVRLSREMLDYIDARAAKENRSRSNTIETMLKEAREAKVTE